MSASDVETIFAELQHAGVRYLVVGGVAVVLHGHPRFTADLIALKRIAARPKDLEGIRALESLQQERGDG